MSLLLLAADAVDPYAFGNRDIAGLIFVGVAIVAIWLGFLHLQGLTEREVKVKPEDPKP
jgi:hypothetical protein